MSVHDDRNINREINEQRRAEAEGWSMTSIVLGSLAALAVVFGLFFMMSDRTGPSTATRTDRPAVTTTAPAPAAPAQTTTGSGATSNVPPARPAQ